MKKLIATILCAALVLSLAACGNNTGSNTTTSASTSETTAETTTAETTESAPETTAPEAAQLTTEKILQAIRDAYGDNYLSNAEIPAENLTSEFGIEASMYDEVSAEMPMIGFHPDRVVIVKATDETNAAAIEEAFNATKTTMVENQITYPVNLAKVNSAAIVRNGLYVGFILAGAPDDREDPSDEEALSFAQNETQKGVDAFNACFQ